MAENRKPEVITRKPYHMLDRCRLALHGNRTIAEVHALAGELLAFSCRHARGLWGSHANSENLALSPFQQCKIRRLIPRMVTILVIGVSAAYFFLARFFKLTKLVGEG